MVDYRTSDAHLSQSFTGLLLQFLTALHSLCALFLRLQYGWIAYMPKENNFSMMNPGISDLCLGRPTVNGCIMDMVQL